MGAAMARHGGPRSAWIDLSTGINRRAWPSPAPLPGLPPEALTALPDEAMQARCEAAAREAYGIDAEAACLAMAGAQAAIGLLPRVLGPLSAPGQGAVRILGPTYNEHAAAFAAEGWQVEETRDGAALAGARVAVVVNPNNPDGSRHEPTALRALAGTVGTLIVDESFGDVAPELSLCPLAGQIGNLIILRSLGKFYGLAGLRLGFAVGPQALIAGLRAAAGPWAVSGPALSYGAMALRDRAWALATRARLAGEAARLDALAEACGLEPLGGTDLFRLYRTDALALRERLAAARIWTRAFGYDPRWLRLGLPGSAAEWQRLEAALAPAAST
ncbi:MAG: threonine-phosphate decarboxylase CobD [Pseudomonadota bacterium]